MCDCGSERANAGSEPIRYMGMDPGLSFQHFQTDLPIHLPGGRDHYIKGWAQRRTNRMVFYGAHIKKRSTHGLGAYSQFHWISARVTGNTCLSRPIYHSHLSVPDIYIVLFGPKYKSGADLGILQGGGGSGPEFFEGGV